MEEPDRGVKFSHPDTDPPTPYDYGNRWQREEYPTWSRLTIGPTRDHIELAIRLARTIDPPFYLLWVLLVPASDHKPGRYQSPPIASHEALADILTRYAAFFESDSRHHLWIGVFDGHGQIVYDNHNILYAYGPLDDFEGVLLDAGLTRGTVEIPCPHVHHYTRGAATTEDALFDEWVWEWYPLVDEHDDP